MLKNKHITATFVATALFMAPVAAMATLSAPAVSGPAKNVSVVETLQPVTAKPATGKSALIMIAQRRQIDPTQGRLNQRRNQRNQAYFQCADFSLRVLNACLGQSNGNPQKQAACRSHYQGNIVRCQNAS